MNVTDKIVEIVKAEAKRLRADADELEAWADAEGLPRRPSTRDVVATSVARPRLPPVPNPCIEETCGRMRHKGFARCIEHQRDQWRVAEQKKRAKAKARNGTPPKNTPSVVAPTPGSL